MLQTTAVIVGGGPAGAGTSAFLSKAGIPHIILEKEMFPRDKVCGDGFSGKTASVLHKANPAWLDEIMDSSDFAPSYGITFVAPNGNPLHIAYDIQPGHKAPGFLTSRLHFDDFLFRKLPSPYATIYQHATIQQIVRQQDGQMLLTALHDGRLLEIKADIVVGADGDKSVVRKSLLQAAAANSIYAVGVRAYFDGVAGMHPGNYPELHFLRGVLPGYFWIFPLPNGRANVGLGIPSHIVRRKKLNVREILAGIVRNHPVIKNRFKDAVQLDKLQGWGLPMSADPLPVSGEGFLLTGDAASLIDPFSGEGIGNALYSGMLAAGAIVKAKETGNFSAAFLKQHYDDELYRRILSELRTSAALQRLCRYPWLFNFVINKARKSPSLQQTITGMFANLDLRDQLRKPSFYLDILMNK